MKIEPIKFTKEVEALLTSEKLPVSDLINSDHVELFGCELNGKLAGVVGVETQENVGLLRSLVVSGDMRGTGYGQDLVVAAESWAFNKGITHLYLLTTNADNYFLKLGYEVVSRDQAPSFIANTPQFSGLCPSFAIFMSKTLTG